MKKTQSHRLRLMGAAIIAFAAGAAGMAQAQTCAEEIPEIKAQIDAMPDDADKSLAERQYEKAQERLAAGKEKSCLRYLSSARAAIEADRMHDAD